MRKIPLSLLFSSEYCFVSVDEPAGCCQHVYNFTRVLLSLPDKDYIFCPMKLHPMW